MGSAGTARYVVVMAVGCVSGHAGFKHIGCDACELALGPRRALFRRMSASKSYNEGAASEHQLGNEGAGSKHHCGRLLADRFVLYDLCK